MPAHQRILLNTDWMGCSLIIDTPVKDAPEGYQWRLYENGTNVWKKRRILYTDRGDKVCTLLNEPKSRLIDPRAALLEIENEWLYHGIGVRGIQDILRKCCIYTVRGLSRLDLCYDFVPTTDQWETIQKLADGRAYVTGKRCGSGFWSVNKAGWMPDIYRFKRIPHCISWGHKTSNITWKCYYKSKELKDAAHNIGWDKPYIVDCWRQAGFDEYNVWRLEVSMHNCNSLLWNGQPITQDVWGYNTVKLGCDMYENRFKVRENQSHADRSNDKEIEFLPIAGCHVLRCKTYDGEREHHGRITLLRKLVQSLEDEQVLLDKQTREDVLEHIGKIIKRDGLQYYFRSMVGDYYDVWVEKVEQDALRCDAKSDRYDILRDKDVSRGMKPNENF